MLMFQTMILTYLKRSWQILYPTPYPIARILTSLASSLQELKSRFLPAVKLPGIWRLMQRHRKKVVFFLAPAIWARYIFFKGASFIFITTEHLFPMAVQCCLFCSYSNCEPFWNREPYIVPNFAMQTVLRTFFLEKRNNQ